MFESRDANNASQPEFWIDARKLPKATASTFYRKLDETLEAIGFTAGVRETCLPAYADAGRGGRPGIDPVVYFKMLMIGFFENLPSERSIASRCADSLSLRAFLGYGLEEVTPDHSSLSVIRSRLGTEIYQAALELVLRGLREHGLLKGRRGLKPPAGQQAIVLLRPDERDRIEPCRAAGFAGYLIKPLRRASLAARVLAAQGNAAPAETANGEDERIAPAAAPGARVLLAEDNPINALLARTLLEREGCVVDRAASGEETLAAMEAGRYDLILMDVRMPGLSGLDATRALRARGVATPILALTADAFEDDRRACLAAGMDDFLVKPLTADALRTALARWARWTPPTAQGRLAG